MLTIKPVDPNQIEVGTQLRNLLGGLSVWVEDSWWNDASKKLICVGAFKINYFWSIGVLEYWRKDSSHFFNPPIRHHSSTPGPSV
jgi:hypothetical protein